MGTSFQFSTPLDSNVLDDFYQGDLSYALMMFEICIEQMPIEVVQLKEEIEHNSPEGCRKILHKIKPTFGMIGNEPLSAHIAMIEKRIAGGGVTISDVQDELLSIVEEIQETLLLLEQESTNLKRHLNL
ncbi:MAG: Hpt domain-containing protein [Bacteroidetes bacterium]|uniref:Hpt domain-containing protein n=1 Tax=Phaeocystidibacter marisrubri TaxID=1577780 RepID=A0A6L3ZJ69_9FLAO|nr:Hpt domain-containing protein [Phaeocystidibacter marisrubri]KAB2817931.1 Hpt domain-containing protein [Phaeocystidibacter marisrubri]TNE28864.1 MAG: Hpt domain-containing protein [Bacteroidota bacterium]GGH72812.1 hypothetical protein GCM10011318_17170 [Phaeocystidibacter marisrubri]